MREYLQHLINGEWVASNGTENIVERVKAETGGKGVDAIVDMDFSTTGPLLSEGLLARHGKMTCYGSNEQGIIPLPFAMLLFYSVDIKFLGVYVIKPDEKLALIDQFKAILRGQSLIHAIGARFSLDQIIEAHEAVEAGRMTGNVAVAL